MVEMNATQQNQSSGNRDRVNTEPCHERRISQLKPFLKWAGSKRRLLSQLLPYIPDSFDTYIEPFLGAGSLFLALAPKRALLNDACIPLIETWEAIREDPVGVYIEALRRPLEKRDYYIARSEREGDKVQRAGRFIYLNKGAFNGLYRVNLSGQFNVPWGAPKSSFVCDIANLMRVSHVLNNSRVSLSHCDFESYISMAGPNDLVFLDPPYVTSHNDNGFIEYNEKIFSWDDQIRLSLAALDAAQRGATVLVTNANHGGVKALYPGFERVVLNRASTLAASTEKRGRTSEILLIGKSD